MFDGLRAERREDDVAELGVTLIALSRFSPAGYAAAHGLGTPAALAGAELLRSRLLPWKPWFTAAGLDWPEPVRGPQFSDLGILLEAAASGLGVAACTRRVAETWRARGQLEPVFALTTPSPLCYYLMLGDDAAGRPEMTAFADWLIATIAPAPAGA